MVILNIMLYETVLAVTQEKDLRPNLIAVFSFQVSGPDHDLRSPFTENLSSTFMHRIST